MLMFLATRSCLGLTQDGGSFNQVKVELDTLAASKMNPQFNPSQIYAGIRGGIRPTIGQLEMEGVADDGVKISARDRQIQVTGVGEVSVPPDRFSLTIRISAKKDNVQDAKNSVTRRLDYVMQTLTNHNVQVWSWIIKLEHIFYTHPKSQQKNKTKTSKCFVD